MVIIASDEQEQVARRIHRYANWGSAMSNPNPLNFPHAYVIVAPIIEARGFRVRVSGHALRDLDTPAVREIVRNPRGAEGVAA